MNISQRLNTARQVNFTTSELHRWIKNRNYRFSISELSDAWIGRNCAAILELIKPCFGSAGVTLSVSDSSSGFGARFILNDDEALDLLKGRRISFESVDVLFESELPETDELLEN